MGHVNGRPARVGGEGGVGAAGQQKTHNLQVVVLHGVVQRPDSQEEKEKKGDLKLALSFSFFFLLFLL